MKIVLKLYIAATIILVGTTVQQSFAMKKLTKEGYSYHDSKELFKQYTQDCIAMSVKPWISSQEQVNKVLAENPSNSTRKDCCDRISEKIMLLNKAKRQGTYYYDDLSVRRNGFFTKLIWRTEGNTVWKNIYLNDSDLSYKDIRGYHYTIYDYKRIFGAIGLGLSAASIASYFFRNEVASLFNARLMPLVTLAASKIPFAAKGS